MPNNKKFRKNYNKVKLFKTLTAQNIEHLCFINFNNIFVNFYSKHNKYISI